MKFRETAGDGREDVWPGPHVANVSILGQPHVLEREAAESRPVPEYEVDEGVTADDTVGERQVVKVRIGRCLEDMIDI